MERKEREQEIVSFEIKLGVEFPQSYREFLLGEAPTEVAGFQILGLPESGSPEKGN